MFHRLTRHSHPGISDLYQYLFIIFYVVIVIAPPLGMASIAFSEQFTMTCWS